MLQNIQNFFIDLRRKDQFAKKNWILAMALAVMLIIFLIWIFYINTVIKNLNTMENSKNKSGFFSTLQQGMEIISSKIGSQASKTFENVQNYAGKTNSVTIQPANISFTTNIKSITPQKFP